jgi:hypothetical protein
MNTRQALKMIKEELEPSAERQTILEFIDRSQRGLMKGFRQSNGK